MEAGRGLCPGARRGGLRRRGDRRADERVQVNTESNTASAIFTDRDVTRTHTVALWDWGDNTTSSGTVTDPTTENAGIVTGSHSYTAAGVYTVTLT